MLFDDDRAQSIQIGAVLLFAILMLLFSTYQSSIIPDQNQKIEYDQNLDTQEQFTSIRNVIVAAHDTETDPFYRPSDLLPESGSELAVPLKIGDRAIGALDVHDKGRYAFSEDDIVVLETLADQIAVAVENARLFQEALRRAEREQSVVQITSKIRASKDIDSILRTAVEEMRQALGAREATIRLAPVPAEIGENGQQSNGTEASTDNADGRTAMPPAETEA
jgi:GAF domain-containing protein